LDRHDLGEAAFKMMAKLDHVERSGIDFFVKLRPVLTVGTTCSGTDLCVFSLNAAAAAINAALYDGKPEFEVTAKFACDIKPIAQQFIMKFHDPPPTFIFRDVKELSRRTAHDVISQSQQHVPVVSWLFTGFCCTDLSHLNIDRHLASDTIAQADRKTGSTFHATLLYIQRNRPIFITLENVVAIDEIDSRNGYSNLDKVLEKLEHLGYVVLTLRLDPRDHGCPHRRARLSIIPSGLACLLALMISFAHSGISPWLE
jgi:site-specific DNA-cytosine methylase